MAATPSTTPSSQRNRKDRSEIKGIRRETLKSGKAHGIAANIIPPRDGNAAVY
jgi:hypothetical protein